MKRSLFLLPFLSLFASCAARAAWTLETAPGGDVHCAAASARLLPMRREAGDAFRGFVAETAVEAPPGADAATLRWSFAPKAADAENVVMLKLDADRWAGGAVTLDGGAAVALPAAHEKGRNIHLCATSTRTAAFTAPAGGRLRLDFGAPVRLHAMDEREWGLGTFVFRFATAADALAATLDAGRPLAVRARPPYVIERGTNWIPVRVARGIAAGTALDFAPVLGHDAPAGRHGRVIARGRHFAFEDSPDVPRRFYGVNLCTEGCFAREDVAEAFVAQMARRGYNALRLHHHDNGLVEGSADGTTINPGQLARMDALLASCGRHGVYVTTDLFVSRRVPRRAIGQDRDGFVGMDEFKCLTLVNEAAFANLCAFARQWLAHVNPHTGLRWADDPTLAFLAFVNEGHLGMDGMGALRRHPEYAAAWAAWAPAHGVAEAEIPDGRPWDRTPQMEAVARFLADLEMRFARRMRAFLKDELGVKALLTDMSAGMEREPFRAVRAACYDYVDEHFYWDHPTWPGVPWRTPVRSLNTNPVKARGADVLAECARVGLADKPFAVTEYSFAGPGAYRSMAGLVAGAQAAREDWGGVWRFDWGGSPWAMAKLDEVRAGLFSLGGDALARATERAALCLFLRGDLAVGDADAVAADRATGAFAVRTARTAGGFTETGTIRAGALAAVCDAGPVALWASTLDGRPFAASRRILVTHLTDLCNTGDTYADATRTILLAWGRTPHLMRAGRAQVALAAGAGDFAVYALDTSGVRVREVPHVRTPKGRLTFTADVAADPAAATFLYEIIRR